MKVEAVKDAIMAMDPSAKPTAFAVVWLEDGVIDPLAFWFSATDEECERLKAMMRSFGGR